MESLLEFNRCAQQSVKSRTAGPEDAHAEQAPPQIRRDSAQTPSQRRMPNRPQSSAGVPKDINSPKRIESLAP